MTNPIFMKKIIPFLFLNLIIVTVSYSQDTQALWPINGKKPGDGIIYRPQDYIGEELNNDKLFIGASEGTSIIAPIDGIIDFLRYGYSTSLKSIISFKIPINPTLDIVEYDKQHRKLIADTEKNVIPEFISLYLSISSGNGENYYISGIRPVKYFKTGYNVKKGEVIGTVGFCYKSISQPSICLSRSVNGNGADPMTPFGLKSTYIPYKSKIDFSLKVPVNNLLEDFKVFRDALEEGHPGLYDYTSKTNMDKLFELTLSKISQPMTPLEFQRLLLPIIDSVRDSHTTLSLSVNSPNNSIVDLPIHFGVLNNSLFIFQTIPEYKNLLGKNIVEINGIKSNDLVKNINILFGISDGYIQSQNDYYRLTLFYSFYKIKYNKVIGDKVSIIFSDGTQADFVYQSMKDLNGFVPALFKNSHRGNFETKKITDNIAYLRLYTFELSETDFDSISKFIKEISNSSYTNLIIDLRGNRGGTEYFAKIFSLIAEKPFKTSSSSMVTKNNTYDFFKNCSNYNSDTKLFPDFKEIEAKRGFYQINDNLIQPNNSIHYGGSVYVITNEFSFSASTIFAALVHKYQRGKIVGRETGSSYYQINADKFANVTLKNSGLGLRVPLIKEIFDDKIDKSIPWGRGVIPDFPIKLSFDTFVGTEDKLLNSTIQIIQKSTTNMTLN
jgi:C-terminal processing protease CtpA/Prc